MSHRASQISKYLWVAIAAVLMSSSAFAASGITYQGRILKPDGTPLAGANVQFKIQIRTPNSNNCLMYEEMQSMDMRNSNGVFALTINDGTGSRTDLTGLNLDRVFSNAPGTANVFTFDPTTCSVGSNYSPSSGDGRNLVVMFKDETMAAFEPMPAQKINFVPFAFAANQVGGFLPQSLVRVAESDGTLDSVSPLSNANYTELLNLIGGTSAQYAKQSAAAGTIVSTVGGTGNVATPSAGSVWLDTAAGNLKFYDGATVKTVGTSGGSVTSVATGTGLTGGPITTTGTISLATLGTGGTGFKVTYDTYGRVTGAVALVEADIPTLTTAGHVSGSAITSGTIAGNTAINTTGTISSGAITSSGLITSPSLSSTAIGTQSVQIFETTNSFKVSIVAPASLGANYTLTLPTTAGASNQVLTTNGSGVLTWTTPAGTGISALTSDVSAAGTGSVAATVNSVGGSSAANVHSAELAANAATNLNTASTIVKRDGSGNFSASAITHTSSIFKDTGANTVTFQAPTTVTTSYVLKLPPAVAASAGQYLSSDTSGNLSWSTLPSSMAPSGAAGGDLSGTYPNPTVATVGTSTAANIHSAELAANAATALNTNSKIIARDGSGNFAANVATVNGVALNNAGSILNITNPFGGAWNMTLPATAGSNGQVMQTNGSGVMSWTTPLTSATGFVNGGNSFGAVSNIGNNDNFDLNIKTNNLSRLTVQAGGNVGVGTAAPSSLLDIEKAQNGSTQLRVLNSDVASAAAAEGIVFGSAASGGTYGSLGYSNAGNTSGAGIYAARTTSLDGGDTAGLALSASNASGTIKMYTGGYSATSERLRIDASGNVGIGTTAPGTRLEVNANGNEQLHVTNASGGYFFAGFDNGGNRARIGGYNGGWTNLTMEEYGGNVGIGTTSPATKLEVSGSLKIGNGGETCAAGIAGGVRYNSGNIEFCNGTSWGALAGASAAASSVAASAGTAAAPSISFSGNTNTGLYSNGANVIGITAGGANVFNVSSSGLVSPTTGGASVTTANGTAAAPTYSFAGDTGTGWWRPAASTMAASTGGSERVRIDSSGNIGIGTTAPSAKLSIGNAASTTGALSIVSNSGATGSTNTAVDLDMSSGQVNQTNTGMSIHTLTTSEGSATGIDLPLVNARDNAYGFKANITKIWGGSALFGTAAGVHSTVETDSSFAQSYGGYFNNKSIVGATAYGVYANAKPGATDAAPLVAAVNGTEVFRVSSSGNVGIGTTAPASKLHIMNGASGGTTGAGAFTVESSGSTYLQILSTATSFSQLRFGDNVASNKGVISYSHGSDVMGFYTASNGSPRMAIDGSGNVGIGTNAPAATLDVNGAIYSRTQTSAAGVTNINFLTGNVQVSNNATNNAAFNICGLQDGGSYTLILKAQPNGSVPTFTPYSDAACSSGITYFDTGGVSLLVSSPTVVLTFVRAGSTVYAMYATGFTH